MLRLLFLVAQLLAVGNALVGSVRERFHLGTIAAVLRAVLLVASAVCTLLLAGFGVARGLLPVPPVLSLVAVLATALGPLVSFGVLWIAHRRSSDVPAALEEKLGRPFRAWLPVVLLDAAAVVISVLGWVFARGG